MRCLCWACGPTQWRVAVFGRGYGALPCAKRGLQADGMYSPVKVRLLRYQDKSWLCSLPKRRVWIVWGCKPQALGNTDTSGLLVALSRCKVWKGFIMLLHCSRQPVALAWRVTGMQRMFRCQVVPFARPLLMISGAWLRVPHGCTSNGLVRVTSCGLFCYALCPFLLCACTWLWGLVHMYGC